ncbi:hypothetical protein ERUR111494_02595 [Erysipelothrix urinaevulpis]|uniref:hypothetical protein n=1 Tax=Erysipelothrix urinaevulpis TaxID=2683717 RepID=UPI00135ABDD1|nr:hypothetical protein [Erysipelothrix urinaevulpis]
MWPTNQVYKDFATAQTRTPVPIVLVNSIEIDIISIEFKEPRETFVGGFSSKYIVLEVDRDAYVGTYYGAEIEPYIQFKGDLTKVPIGKFYVDKEDVEFDEVQKKYTITAYDSAIKFDKQYEPMKWPMKGKEFISEICQSVGVEFHSASIPNIPFYEKSLRGINVNEKELISYRQVINEFARLNFCSVHINRLGQLEFKNVFMNQISETITGYDYKDLKLDKEVKPFNSLVYEQKDINDPVFIKNQESIYEFGLTELKMTDNIFVDVMDRNQQQVYVNEMFQFVSGFTYHKFESNQIMRPDYDGCDLIEYEDMDGNRFKTILTNISWSWVNGGLQGSMDCPQLPETITKYELAGERQDLLNMGIDVDRANKKITSLIQDVGDRADKETSLTQDVDSINIKVNSLDVGSNLIPNLNALLPMVDESHTGWKFDDKPIFEVEEDLRSLSKHKKVFNHKGTAETSKAFIVPDSVYSYRMKRLALQLEISTSEKVVTEKNQGTLKVYVKEFNSEEVLIKSTPFYLEGKNIIETITFQPIAETSYVSLLFENNNDFPFAITEEMFTRGNPAKWEEDSEDLKLWSQAQFNIQNDRITNTVEQVNIFNDDLTERIQGAEDQLSEQEGQIQDVSKEAAAEVTKVRTELLSSLEQTAEQQELVFRRIESVQDGQEERLNEMATFYRYDIDGAIVGREGDPMQFYFSNDEASFRNNGERISYWRGKKFYVEELEVLASIIIGQHLIESEGNNTKVRSVN